MYKYQNDVVLNNAKTNVVMVGVGLTVTVYDIDGSLSTIYAFNAVGANVNPLTTNENGHFEFYAADGRYNFIISGAGIATLSYTDVLVGDKEGGGGGIAIAYQPAPPDPTPLGIWIDSTDGAEYIYVNDGNSSQWVGIGTSNKDKKPAPFIPIGFDILSLLFEGGNYSSAFSVSADGAVVIGDAGHPEYYGVTFKWTEETGMTVFGRPDEVSWYYGMAISADGTTIVGYGYDGVIPMVPMAFRWTEETGFVNLGNLGNAYDVRAYGVSSDGSVVTGSAYNEAGTRLLAYRWTEETGMVAIDAGVDYQYDVAYDISDDGTTIVGFNSETGAFRWTEETGKVVIEGMTVAYSVSADGSVVVGYYFNYDNNKEYPVMWTEETGAVTVPFTASGEGYASGVSADGLVVVGSSISSGWVRTARYWSELTGSIRINAYQIYNISADGTVLVGMMADDVGFRAKVLVLTPEPEEVIELNFPTNPALHEPYTAAGKTWRWTGLAWQLLPSPVAVLWDGELVTAKAKSINFVGNVEVTTVGDDVTVSVGGGGYGD